METDIDRQGQGIQSTHKHRQNRDSDKYEGGGPSCSVIMVTSPVLQIRKLKFLNITLEDVLQRELSFYSIPLPSAFNLQETALPIPPCTLLSPAPGLRTGCCMSLECTSLFAGTTSPQFAQLTCTQLRHCLQEDPWILSVGWGMLFPASLPCHNPCYTLLGWSSKLLREKLSGSLL